jgi:Bacterial SH3 domain
VRARTSLLLAGLASLAVVGAAAPLGAQCYPGLACPTEQQQEPSQPSTKLRPPLSGGTIPNAAAPNALDGSRTRQNAVEYHYVGPVNPPDDYLALRTLPTAKTGERIMKMPAGTMFRVGEKRGDWWFVTLQDGTTGWANATWIRCCKYANE